MMTVIAGALIFTGGFMLGVYSRGPLVTRRTRREREREENGIIEICASRALHTLRPDLCPCLQCRLAR